MLVQINNEQSLIPIDAYQADLEALFTSTLQHSELLQYLDEEKSAGVNIVFLDDKSIQAINKEHRGKDEVTDVLSFPLLEMREGKLQSALEEYDFSPVIDDESGEMLENQFLLELGDVIINTSRALEQAKAYGHSIKREILFLAVHSYLHLLGYDHMTEEEESIMNNKQEEILQSRGISRDEDFEEIPLNSSENTEDVHTYETSFLETAEEELSEDFKSGFVSIIGRPNAGKSTLLNALIGSELAITSRKAQTTRNNIRCVLDDGEMQVIFVDTPGIHRSKNKLDRFMSDSAWRAMIESDLVLLLVDPEKRKITEVEEVCVQKAKENNIPVLLLLTKADAVEKENILQMIAKYDKFYDFAQIIPISSVKGDNLDVLLSQIKAYLPNGPRYYHQDAYTDQSERALCAEYIREQVLHFTHQEIPHKAAVVIDSFEEKENEKGERSLVLIHASIITDKDSHKGMIIGKNAQMLKRIGQHARIKMEAMLEAKVYLDLHVKVRRDWQNKDNILQDLGYTKGSSGPSAEDIL